ncbi:MAG: hypothetical protein D6775_13145 [Caldilineae bacterium]|nr:MAG: hypothetical protein D6775_13145 [Caldilineae bacterium]
MGTKRYLAMIAAFFLAILTDAFIYVSLLDTPWTRVPAFFHLANIIVLAVALAILLDMIFKVDLLR